MSVQRQKAVFHPCGGCSKSLSKIDTLQNIATKCHKIHYSYTSESNISNLHLRLVIFISLLYQLSVI